MLSRIFSLETQRKRLLRRAPQGPVRDYLSVPFPDENSEIHSVPLLSLDFETTGLDVRHDRILSIGHVAIEGGEILLSSATHRLVRADDSLREESVVIHRITDDVAAFGKAQDEVIADLLQALAGKVLLAHHSPIECGFLGNACKQLYGLVPVFPVIDTLNLARQWFTSRNKEIAPGDLRLFNLRERYGLPRYNAHNALSDALSTAELFLAQVEHMDSRGTLRLKRFLSR
jgi:DNA polymerase-3 subunit epsilon